MTILKPQTLVELPPVHDGHLILSNEAFDDPAAHTPSDLNDELVVNITPLVTLLQKEMPDLQTSNEELETRIACIADRQVSEHDRYRWLTAVINDHELGVYVFAKRPDMMFQDQPRKHPDEPLMATLKITDSIYANGRNLSDYIELFLTEIMAGLTMLVAPNTIDKNWQDTVRIYITDVLDWGVYVK